MRFTFGEERYVIDLGGKRVACPILLSLGQLRREDPFMVGCRAGSEADLLVGISFFEETDGCRGRGADGFRDDLRWRGGIRWTKDTVSGLGEIEIGSIREEPGGMV